MKLFQHRDDCNRVIRQVQNSAGRISVLMRDFYQYKAGVAHHVCEPAVMREFANAILRACDEAEGKS